LRLKVAFVGFRGGRAKQVAKAIEAASAVELDAAEIAETKADAAVLAAGYDAVFVSTAAGLKRLDGLVGEIRRDNAHVPIVITYGEEPEGSAFQVAATQDCWLFSDIDRLKRGLTAEEIGLGLEARGEASELGSRLMEISMMGGPCSTGD
jgi:hypothetical protein